MLAWILILGSWVALLSLILQDVTTDDGGGGAVRVAAGNVGAAASWAVMKAKTLRKTPGQGDSQVDSQADLRSDLQTDSQIASEEPAATPPSYATPPEQQVVAPSKRDRLDKRGRRNADQRISMTAPDLERAISEAVRKASPGCEDFVSVIVESKSPEFPLAPDWEVRGVRFGRADRKVVDEALSAVVQHMQQEVRLDQDV
jgi:hypothetical protein